MFCPFSLLTVPSRLPLLGAVPAGTLHKQQKTGAERIPSGGCAFLKKQNQHRDPSDAIVCYRLIHSLTKRKPASVHPFHFLTEQVSEITMLIFSERFTS